MVEAHARWHGETSAVRLIPLAEFRLAGVLQGGDVGSQEIHFLGQPPLDDRIVAIQSERHGLAR